MLDAQRLIGSVRGEYLGYGLYRAWILEHMAFIRNTSVYFDFSQAQPIVANMPLWILYLAIAFSALFFIVLQRVSKTRFLAELVPDCMAVLGFAGSAGIALGCAMGNYPMLLASCALVGLCGGFFEVKWGLNFLGMQKGAVYVNVLVAILLASICGIFTNAVLPTEAFAVVAIVLLAGTVFLDRMVRERAIQAEAPGDWTLAGTFGGNDIRIGEYSGVRGKAFGGVAIASLLYSVIHLSAITLCYDAVDSSANYAAVRHLANFCVVVGLLAYYLHKRTASSIQLLRVILPLTAAGLFLLLIDHESLGGLAYFLMCFANKLFEISIWILAIEFVGLFPLSGANVFGGIVAARNAGSFIGSVLSVIVLMAMGSDASGWTAYVSALVMLAIVTLMWLVSGKAFYEPLYRADTERRIETESGKIGYEPSKLRMLAEEHALTFRETDVFLLLARGKNRAAIAEELCISQNTVHTHIVHVYQKLGVHNQQDLIRRVESCESGE